MNLKIVTHQKMAKLLFAAAMLFAVNCAAQEIPKIGDIWEGEVRQNERIYAFPPYSLERMIKFKVDNIEFRGAVTEEKKVIFISTRDPNFLINGRKYVGMPFASFESKRGIGNILGWGRYAKIDDEWYAAFDFKTQLTDSSRVLFLFKARVAKNRVASN